MKTNSSQTVFLFIIESLSLLFAKKHITAYWTISVFAHFKQSNLKKRFTHYILMQGIILPEIKVRTTSYHSILFANPLAYLQITMFRRCRHRKQTDIRQRLL